MRILILGGTAFLSTAVAKEAQAQGLDVTCLARGTTTSPPAGVRWLTADRDEGTSAYPAEDFDAVVDVSRHPLHVRDALAALGDRVGHWTFVSSVSVYADHTVPGRDVSDDLLPPFGGDLLLDGEDYGGAKVACEQACQEAVGDRLLINRPGLIVGAGDPSDRFGYWPARFARGAADPVLVPAVETAMQVIGVHDLARWIVVSAIQQTTGIFNAVGDPMPLPEMLDRVQRAVGHRGDQVKVDHDWLVEQKVAPWAGPESLPLWLPTGEDGLGARNNAAAKAVGLEFAPLEDVVAESLAYERSLGLDRERRSGLSPAREQKLLELWALRQAHGA